MLLNILGMAVLLTIASLTGIVIFAYYVQQDCDPLTSGRVGNPNQVSRFLRCAESSCPC